MINNKEKKMIQRYCIYPKIAVVALIFSFVQCALIVPLEMIDDLVFQNKGFQPTGMFTALGLPRWQGKFEIDETDHTIKLKNYGQVENLIDLLDERYTRSDVTDEEYDTRAKKWVAAVV